MKRFICILTLSVITVMVAAVNVDVAAEVIPTDVDTPSENCVFLGIEGKYITEIQKALDRINDIRLEACKQGVTNPDSGKKLTMSDYTPIKWSSDLEYIARIRAAEASVIMDHERLNKKSIWSLQGPKGGFSCGEVIAWNGSETMVDGINQWYEEKSDWVNNNTSAVTGHYTQMIDPSHTYVGLGTFCSKSAHFYNTTVGEFSCDSDLDETRGKSVKQCIRIIEVSKDYLCKGYKLTAPDSLKIGESSQLKLTVSVAIRDYWNNVLKTDNLLVLDEVKYLTDNNCIELNGGRITAKKIGKVKITAQYNGATISKVINIYNNSAEPAKNSSINKKTALKTPNLKVSQGKKQFKVKYKKVAGAAGFQVRYRIKGKWKIKNYKVQKSATKIIKGLKKGKYKVQIRAFSLGKKSYSKWSKTKTVMVK